MAQRKVIISCAVTGSIHTPSMSPHLPVTAKEIVESALGAAEAGAASLWVAAGKLAPTNAAQVVQMREIIEALGLEVATPDEAREILRLKGGDGVAF
jgi:uncharacterized protein (DUF849 family)